MNHDTASDQFAYRQPLQFGTQTCFTLGIGGEVGHVATMPGLALMMAMTLTARVVMALGATGIGGAAIACLMHMETMLTRCQPDKLGIDLNTATKIAEGNVAGYSASGSRLNFCTSPGCLRSGAKKRSEKSSFIPK
jgi:hypothetical protein